MGSLLLRYSDCEGSARRERIARRAPLSGQATSFRAWNPPTQFAPLPIHRYYSGYLVNLTVETSADEQTIVATIENYLAALSEGSGLTYLHQSEFDPGDKSASQTLAAANGMQKAGVSGSYGRGGGGGGGGGRDVRPRQVMK